MPLSTTPRARPAGPRHLEGRRLTGPECRAWLTGHREGRLGYLSGAGPRSVVVCYALAGDQIVVRLPEYNDIVRYAPGAVVRLDVDGSALAEHETVSVTGTATLVVGTRDGEAETSEAVENWPAGESSETWPTGVHTAVMTVPLTRVEGYARPA